jgi:hypothetical protein
MRGIYVEFNENEHLKRKPVKWWDENGHLRVDTKPYETLEELLFYLDCLKEFRPGVERKIKCAKDMYEFMDFVKEKQKQKKRGVT